MNGVNGEASTAGAEATTSSAAASGVNTDDEAAKAAKKAKKEAKKEAKKDKKSKEARGEEQEEEDEHKYDVIAIQNAVDALITAPPHKVSLADMVVALAKDQGVDTEDASAMQAAQSAFLNAVSIARAGQGETLTLR